MNARCHNMFKRKQFVSRVQLNQILLFYLDKHTYLINYCSHEASFFLQTTKTIQFLSAHCILTHTAGSQVTSIY